MKSITLALIIILAGLALSLTNKQATAEPKAQKHQAVVLHTHEYSESQYVERDAYSTRYAGMRVYNSSSSAGAPTFTNLASYYSSATRTNEFGQIQQGYYAETTKPVQIADAIAQLLDDGFRLVNVETPNEMYGPGPTRYVFVK